MGPLPFALAEVDGTLKKTAKCLLMHKLEGKVDPVVSIDGDYAFIADGMAFVRQIRSAKLVYREFAVKLLNLITCYAKSAKRIDVVFDVYVDNSIKDVERARRSHGEITLKQIVPTAQINQWNQLLSSGEFKNKLIRFIVNEWGRQSHLVGSKILFATVDDETYMITSESFNVVDELRSDHQEADTRLLLHAKHAILTYGKIVISTPDTDVFMIALSKSTVINANLYILTGTKDKRRLIDIDAVGEEIYTDLNKTDCRKEDFLDALLGFHCFTGCDTTSSFARRGKIKPLLLLGTNQDYIDAFSSLGSSENVSA